MKIVLTFICCVAASILFAQDDKQQMLDGLKQAGYIRQEGNHIIFKVKKASDTPQIKLLYGSLFASDKYTIGFEVDGKYFGKKPVVKPGATPTAPKPADKPVYEAVITKPVTATIATADEMYLRSGTFIIRSARDYRYLTVKTSVPAVQSLIVLSSYWGSPAHQEWKLIPQTGGYYKIQSQSGLYLSQKRILAPTLEEASAEESQLWQLTETTDGFYKIKSKTNKWLFLAGSNNKEECLVGFSVTEKQNAEQKWHLIKWTEDGRRQTAFDPATNGFRFINNFNGEDFIRWGGLCGGMVYTALDYFNHSIPVPLQTYMPANRTTLQSYIYERQNHSMWDVNSSWTDLEVSYNTRGGELFRWGIEGTGSGRLKEVIDAVNAGRSKPLGMFAGGVRGKNNSDGGRHVVLAIGYAMGRYTGNLTGHIEDAKIFIYNPNEGNTTRTLMPDRLGQCFFEVETGKAWRTYFVNNRYDGSHTPPRDIPNYPEGEAEGSVRHLYATFYTGGDDLRGGNDNVSITVMYTDGSSQLFSNVNNGARWVDKSEQTVHLALDRAVQKSDVRGFMITVSFGSDLSSDDWNMDAFYVSSGWGGISYARAKAADGQPYRYRFSGDQRTIRHFVPRWDE